MFCVMCAAKEYLIKKKKQYPFRFCEKKNYLVYLIARANFIKKKNQKINFFLFLVTKNYFVKISTPCAQRILNKKSIHPLFVKKKTK